jgi:hypothetical protein
MVAGLAGLVERPADAPEWVAGAVREVTAESPWGPARWLVRPAALTTAEIRALKLLEVQVTHTEGWQELLGILARRALAPSEMVDPLRRALRGLAGLPLARETAETAAAVATLTDCVVAIAALDGPWLPLRLVAGQEAAPTAPTPESPIRIHWTRLTAATRAVLLAATE